MKSKVLLCLVGISIFSSSYGQNVGVGTSVPKSKLDVTGSLAVGTYAGVTPAPANGSIISGSVGIGTSSPFQKLDVAGAAATATINSASILSLTRPQTPSVKWGNSAEFALGSYSTAINANTRLDIKLSDGGTDRPDVTPMTILGNGTVGINTSTIPTESSLVLGARDAVSEGGQLQLNAPGGSYTTAFFADNYQNQLRFMYGTNTGSVGVLMTMRGSDQAILGKFRMVSYHNFHNSNYNSNTGKIWYLGTAGGEGADDEWIGLAGQDNDAPRTWVAPYSGKLVKIILRVGNDSGSNPDFAGTPVMSINGAYSNLDGGGLPSLSVDNDNFGTYTPTQNNSFNRGDRLSVGFRVDCGSCHIEDTDYYVTLIWEYNEGD